MQAATVEMLGKYHLWWGGNGQRLDWAMVRGLRSGKHMFNRIEGNVEVCRKNSLALNIARTCGAPPWLPATCVVSKGGGNQAWASMQERYDKAAANGQGRVWIVKPGAMNRGRGIELADSMEKIKAIVASGPAGSTWVVQKYIERPLLVGGRKFDIRAFALVTPDGGLKMFEDAYVRTSSSAYNLAELGDLAAHLTNDAVQKSHGTYGAHEDHNKLSLEELDEKTGGRHNIVHKFKTEMRQIVADVFGGVAQKFNTSNFQWTFELFGLDFMLDDRGQVYLIEINTSPALFLHGSKLTKMLPQVIEGIVQCCVDPKFPPPPGWSATTVPPGQRFTDVPGNVRIGRPSVRARSFVKTPSRLKQPAAQNNTPGANGQPGAPGT
ncbi:unnamed protein product [Pedinophyceae sp. YPF-701]|nr:unnamed protein product [Pedinophyceae sp. YPF-701]